MTVVEGGARVGDGGLTTVVGSGEGVAIVAVGPDANEVAALQLLPGTGVAFAGPAWIGLQPGRAGRSKRVIWSVLTLRSSLEGQNILTSVSLLADTRSLRAFIYIGVGADGKYFAALGKTATIGARIHGLLERISIPSEYVVGVLPVPSANLLEVDGDSNWKVRIYDLRIAHAPDKWLATVLGPHGVERPRIPDGLHEDLRYPYGVGIWAFTIIPNEETACANLSYRICDVVLKVGFRNPQFSSSCSCGLTE